MLSTVILLFPISRNSAQQNIEFHTKHSGTQQGNKPVENACTSTVEPASFCECVNLVEMLVIISMFQLHSN